MAGKVDVALGVLNGALGQYLDKTRNGLAIEMSLVHAGARLPVEREALTRAFPAPRDKLIVLVHGLMATEAVWAFPDGSDYGQKLAEAHELTPLYVRYNTGLSIGENGAKLARLLEALVERWPLPVREIVLLGFSMGGLVARASTHAGLAARHAWPAFVRRAFYVGTPHLGSPLERLGRGVTRVLHRIPDPYAQLVAQLMDLRSDGIKDLGHGDPRHPVPLLPHIQHHLVAGAITEDPRLMLLFGDLLVPLRSATAGRVHHTDHLRAPPERVCIIPNVGHNALAHHPEVLARLSAWMREAA